MDTAEEEKEYGKHVIFWVEVASLVATLVGLRVALESLLHSMVGPSPQAKSKTLVTVKVRVRVRVQKRLPKPSSRAQPPSGECREGVGFRLLNPKERLRFQLLQPLRSKKKQKSRAGSNNERMHYRNVF